MRFLLAIMFLFGAVPANAATAIYTFEGEKRCYTQEYAFAAYNRGESFKTPIEDPDGTCWAELVIELDTSQFGEVIRLKKDAWHLALGWGDAQYNFSFTDLFVDPSQQRLLTDNFPNSAENYDDPNFCAIYCSVLKTNNDGILTDLNISDNYIAAQSIFLNFSAGFGGFGGEFFGFQNGFSFVSVPWQDSKITISEAEISAAVPLPPTFLLLFGALTGIGALFILRRRVLV